MMLALLIVSIICNVCLFYLNEQKTTTLKEHDQAFDKIRAKLKSIDDYSQNQGSLFTANLLNAITGSTTLEEATGKEDAKQIEEEILKTSKRKNYQFRFRYNSFNWQIQLYDFENPRKWTIYYAREDETQNAIFYRQKVYKDLYATIYNRVKLDQGESVNEEIELVIEKKNGDKFEQEESVFTFPYTVVDAWYSSYDGVMSFGRQEEEKRDYFLDMNGWHIPKEGDKDYNHVYRNFMHESGTEVTLI